MGALTIKAKKHYAVATQKAREYKAGETMRTGVNAGIMVASAFGGGVLDGKAGDVMGVRPSTAAGIAALTGGIITRSPKAIYMAAGLLSPAAYEAGLNIGEGEADNEAANAPDDEE